MKVYQIITKPYQDFCFYNRNGCLTLCSDPKYPHISGNSIYNGESKTWERINNPMHYNPNDITIFYDNDGTMMTTLLFAPEKMLCPHWFVRKQHYEQHVMEQLPPLIDLAVKTYDDPFNVFVFKKICQIRRERFISY